MSKEKILIVNAIPLNNGDAALVFSLYNKLIEKGHRVKIATYYYEEVTKHYPKLPFVKELAQHKLFVKLPFLKFFLLPILFYFSKAHREATLIIGAPGGYVNSNYNIKSSLQVFGIAKFWKKKTAIYAQSVGPLDKKDSNYFKKLMQKSIDYLLLRDAYSYKIVQELDIPKNKYRLTKDAAFLLQPKEKSNLQSQKIAISVREWGYDNRNKAQYINLIKALTNTAIDNGYEIVFLSTCQGLIVYKNDALLAKEIIQSLPKKQQNKVSLEDSYYTFDAFYQKFTTFDFVIGTRLHMCILAMTHDIPAFNISYEIKGKETYKYLNLEQYAIDYNAPIKKSVLQLEEFIANLPQIKQHLEIEIPIIYDQVATDFEVFYKKVMG